MPEEDKFQAGKPPVFDGNNYDYWNKRMEVHFKALGRDLWKIVIEGYVIFDPKKKMEDDDKNKKLNDRALSVVYNTLALSEFNRVKGLEKAKQRLDFNVTNKDFSHKFLRCLPEKYETIVTLLVRIDLNKMTSLISAWCKLMTCSSNHKRKFKVNQ
jgi:hypothetical protein